MYLQGSETIPATNVAQGDKGNSETTNLGTTPSSSKSVLTPVSFEDQKLYLAYQNITLVLPDLSMPLMT